MRFNCGETGPQRRARKKAERHRHLSNWHLKFAWWPTRVATHDCRWLEYIRRKGTKYYGFQGNFWRWEYREYEDYNPY